MLNVINKALIDNKYYICLYPNHIYIYNYEEIITFNNELVILKIDYFNIVVKGLDLHISKMESKELLINGIIKGVNYE